MDALEDTMEKIKKYQKLYAQEESPKAEKNKKKSLLYLK